MNRASIEAKRVSIGKFAFCSLIQDSIWRQGLESSPTPLLGRDRRNAMDLCLGNSVPIWVTTELGLLPLGFRI